MQILKSACRMCHGGCGVLVHVQDGRVVKVQGDPESPLNRGKLCPKGAASIEQLYHPDRLLHPMKRVGQRGEGKWERISWDEALDTIAGKLAELRKQHGPESIAVGTGTGRHHFAHVPRFANALGTPNWCEPGMAQCFIPRVMTGIMTYGDLPICDYCGDVNPACILVWGHNPIVSGADGEIQFRVKEAIARGTKVILVDPRRTEMAAKADLWLQVRPGTDAALALGMMNVIFGEALYDREFVDRWTVGFDRLAARAAEYPPERVAEITWVPADQIRAAARLFAQTKPATLEWGVALEHTPNCLQTVRSVGLLPAITGNIDIPGGWVLGMHLVNEPDFLTGNLSEETKDRRIGAERFRALCSRHAFFPSAHVPTLFEAMRTGSPYPVKAFLIFGNNALVTYANSREVHETLESLDFLAVMDLYLTPTAELADIVLPAASWLEVDQVVAMPFFAGNVVLAQQRIVRTGECRQDEEVFVDLARRIGLEVGTEPLEAIFDRQLRPLGITFEELKKRGTVSAPMRYRKSEEGGADGVGEGRARLGVSGGARLRSRSLLRGAAGEPRQHTGGREGVPPDPDHGRPVAVLLSLRVPSAAASARTPQGPNGRPPPGNSKGARNRGRRLVLGGIAARPDPAEGESDRRHPPPGCECRARLVVSRRPGPGVRRLEIECEPADEQRAPLRPRDWDVPVEGASLSGQSRPAPNSNHGKGRLWPEMIGMS